MMEKSGPTLETLVHRLAETPTEFLDEPRVGTSGKVHVAALVNDVLALHGQRAPLSALEYFVSSDARRDRNRLALVMIACWLLAEEWFASVTPPQNMVLNLLGATVAEMAQANAAHKFVHDPDRREELVRVVLARLDYRPAGESVAEATDRLSGISGVERKRLLEASRAAEQRAADIRAALARKAAEESADKWSRE
ncbi:hypothetical protein SAMN05192549_101226 [Duganella sacchari]|uniref:Uncharacterized protein n=1 Tax=Duganella sacchari TaxID=551987 RepID=A0A1M7HN62_9BURK|nr:hypothetical protein [Duganella sacchari]SHM29773.1 hypothetical protein SAMN05192549_101226 [Duganella sacchari]